MPYRRGARSSMRSFRPRTPSVQYARDYISAHITVTGSTAVKTDMLQFHRGDFTQTQTTDVYIKSVQFWVHGIEENAPAVIPSTLVQALIVEDLTIAASALDPIAVAGRVRPYLHQHTHIVAQAGTTAAEQMEFNQHTWFWRPRTPVRVRPEQTLWLVSNVEPSAQVWTFTYGCRTTLIMP